MTKDEKKVAEIREIFDEDLAEWDPIRAEGDKDMRFVAGDSWSDADRRQREDAKRPCLALDEMSQFFNQVVNDVRMNPRAVHFAPTGTGSNDKTARFYQDKMREIEYRSNAQIAYLTAFGNTVHRGYGWTRVNSRRESSRSPNQDLWIEDIQNPNMILPDSRATRPDFSDGKRLFVYQSIDKRDFRRRFPKATMQTFGRELMKLAPLWVKRDSVQLAEYWEIEETSRKAFVLRKETALQMLKPEILQDPEHELHEHLQQDMAVTVYASELNGVPTGSDQILDMFDATDRQVMKYLTNGVEILEKTKWAGKYIPFASCLGKILYLDEGAGATRVILSMTRLARDPQQLYNYYRTCEAELVGMTPKFPYFAYQGQLTPSELLNLQKSLHEPIAVVQVASTIEGMPPGQPLGFPQRQPYEPPLQGLELGAEGARRAIQAAFGITPLPTPAQRNNEKTGVAFERIESSGQKGSFHFVDSYDLMIRHVGVICEDLMDQVYDSVRTVGVRDAVGKASQVRINDPLDPQSITTKGDYQTTVSAGPSFESARDAASEFLDALVASPMGPLIADLAVKVKNLGPYGDEIAKRLTPPQFQSQDQQQSPQAMQAKAAQMQQQFQQLQQEFQKLQFEQKADVVKSQATLQGKAMDAQLAITLKTKDDATKIAVALIASGTKTQIADSEAQLELVSTGIDAEHEARLAAKEHLQAATAQGLQHAHDVRQAIHDHAATTAQAEQAHGHAIQQILTQAAVEPDPVPPNGNGAA